MGRTEPHLIITKKNITNKDTLLFIIDNYNQKVRPRFYYNKPKELSTISKQGVATINITL